jgi:predicted RNase H-like nuclease
VTALDPLPAADAEYPSAMLVVGLDACKGWVAIALDERGAFREAREFEFAREAIDAWSELAVLTIDIPIGLPTGPGYERREADAAARAFLPPSRRSSVFPCPPLDVLERSSYADANEASKRLTGRGLSQQSWAIGPKIVEVNAWASEHTNVFEVHPEVSFHEMSQLTGIAPPGSKRTWNGLMQRRRCLVASGISLPDSLVDAPTAGFDDVLDAAAAAWSALRIHRHEECRFPEERSGASVVGTIYC